MIAQNHEPWILVRYLGRHNKVMVTIEFGTKCTVKNLFDYQVEAFCRNAIISVMQRYVNHRREIMLKHGGHYGQKERAALELLQQRLNNSSRWSFDKMHLTVRNNYQLLRDIAPGVTSKFYEHDMKLLNDLQAWAEWVYQSEFSSIKSHL